METFETFAVLSILGQIIFGVYWIFNGVNHFWHLKMLLGYAKSKGVPMPELAVCVSGFFIIFGGASILTGMYLTYGLSLIAVFLLTVTLFIHRFWEERDPMMKMAEIVNFMKNFALFGAILMMYSLMDIAIWPWTLMF